MVKRILRPCLKAATAVLALSGLAMLSGPVAAEDRLLHLASAQISPLGGQAVAMDELSRQRAGENLGAPGASGNETGVAVILWDEFKPPQPAGQTLPRNIGSNQISSSISGRQ